MAQHLDFRFALMTGHRQRRRLCPKTFTNPDIGFQNE
jgi:hypothetical protein